MDPAKANDNDWVANLILAHLDTLTEGVMELALAQIRSYGALAPDSLRQMFAGDYRALAAMLAHNDMAALRAYMDRTSTDLIRQGLPATDLMAVASLLEEGVRRLIDAEAPTPAMATEAKRRVQSITKNIRMILSGINLRLLTSPV